MERRTIIIAGTGFIAGIVAIACILTGYLPAPAPVPAQDTVIVGIMPDESAATVFIAQEKGYFAQEGLNLTVKDYQNGAEAIQGMENGDVNLTLSSEYPLVAEIMGGQDIVVAGTIDKYYGTYLVARRDRGIGSPADLPGKTIALSKNSVGEFYLGRFLALNNIPQENVTLVYLSPDAAESNLSGNSGIDAAVTTPLAAYRFTSLPGNRYVAIPITGGQATFKVVAGYRDWITGHPADVTKFLVALNDASRYAVTNPAGSQEIVETRANISGDYLQGVWPAHQYGLSLDQSLVLAMEGEAQWMIENNLTAAKSVPDFLGSIYPNSMESADPAGVQLVGAGDHP